MTLLIAWQCFWSVY